MAELDFVDREDELGEKGTNYYPCRSLIDPIR